MIKFRQTGNFNRLERFLDGASRLKAKEILESYGRQGVNLLAANTPQDSGETANSWDYNIKVNDSRYILEFTNSNIVDGIPVAILIQYGHGLKNGGYVEGRDFINPAVAPLFDKIAEKLWEEVSNL